MNSINIAPFGLPNCNPGEYYFEEPRDIARVLVQSNQASSSRRIEYRKNNWPEGMWYENNFDMENPARFGWLAIDDHFNGRWVSARTHSAETDEGTSYSFQPLMEDDWHDAESRGTDVAAGNTVRFRRTVALRISPWYEGDMAKIYTLSPAQHISIVGEFAAKHAVPSAISVSTYNCYLAAVDDTNPRVPDAGEYRFSPGNTFNLDIDYMAPGHRYSGDTGLVTLVLGNETISISVSDLDTSPGIFHKPTGLYFTRKQGAVSFASYQTLHEDRRPAWRSAIAGPEQTFAGAMNGQPRPHSVHAHTGVKHARQRFLLEPNGDVVLDRRCLWDIEGGLDAASVFPKDTNGRFYFGLETWIRKGRYRDSSGAPIFFLEARDAATEVTQTILAAPIGRGFGDPQQSSDEPVAAYVRFRFINTGTAASEASITIGYSPDSSRSQNALALSKGQDDYLVPLSEREKLSVRGDAIEGIYHGTAVRRAVLHGTMSSRKDGPNLRFFAELSPGDSCELILVIPFAANQQMSSVSLSGSEEFDDVLHNARSFWNHELDRGASIRTMVPHLDALHRNHLAHVLISDFTMPDNPELINTSVGTSVYGNFSNESCMIVQELIQRGLYEDAKKRLDLWIAYQGTVGQPGNFTDYHGMYFGAGGFEQGNYNQHHGWVLWCIAEFFHLTHDTDWFENSTHSVVDACNWVFRQRETTRNPLAHSRGWETGFLPAGSLEDVEEYHYWLSTNSLTWRAVDHAARALEMIGHPEAERIRRESDAFAADLRAGFEKARCHSPLVSLADGRWIPTYPSRLYCRGRDFGWIREVLEGSIYLLISGLYDSGSEVATWILEDFQENRYPAPPYGYHLRDAHRLARFRGGFSIQPTLLAGLIPYLERDEVETYIWMLFNSIAACYREEIEGFSEHPMPELGFSNDAQFKTSDEANAMMWLRYLFAYWNHDLLHIGRAVPRAWISRATTSPVGVTGLRTYHGTVDIDYRWDIGADIIYLEAMIHTEVAAPRILARFRHPDSKPIQSVRVNGRAWPAFDVATGDVDITGISGPMSLSASF